MPYQPRGLTFEQFNVGDVHVCQGRTVTEADVVHFAGISGDYNPLHTNEEYGKTTPFGGRIAHGVLILALATGQINQTGLFEGTTLALLQQTIKYVGAVKFGDTVHLEFKIAEKLRLLPNGAVVFSRRRHWKTGRLRHRQRLGDVRGEASMAERCLYSRRRLSTRGLAADHRAHLPRSCPGRSLLTRLVP